MSEPYRDRHLACPACNAPLREFRTRQVCDVCAGMMVTFTDLAGAVHDLTSIVPTFAYANDAPGTRPCPHCAAPMIRCHLRVLLESEMEKPRPELDRCDEHGIWFDADELAGVFEKVAGKGHGAGVVSKAAHSSRVSVGGQDGWSAVFKKFGGRGGF